VKYNFIILLYTVHFIYCKHYMSYMTVYNSFHVTVYSIFAPYLHFVPIFWALYLSIIPICRKHERSNSCFITTTITGFSETLSHLQLFKCNQQPMQCVTSQLQNLLVCHVIHKAWSFSFTSMILESRTIWLYHGSNYEDLVSSGKWWSLVWQRGTKVSEDLLRLVTPWRW
jgi:hypothetical protein